MAHNAAFHQGIHFFTVTKQSSAKEIHFNVEIINFDLSVHTMDHPKFIASNQKDESINV